MSSSKDIWEKVSDFVYLFLRFRAVVCWIYFEFLMVFAASILITAHNTKYWNRWFLYTYIGLLLTSASPAYEKTDEAYWKNGQTSKRGFAVKKSLDQPLTIFTKSSILDVCLISQYASAKHFLLTFHFFT